MPRLVKGAKWTFGWVVVGPERKIVIPPEAWDEYGFQVGDEAIFTPGSLKSGGFGVSTPVAAVVPGDCVTTNAAESASGITLKVSLTAAVRPLDVAWSVYPVPALSILSPGKLASPLVAATVVVPESVPLPGFVPIASVT